MAKDYKEQLQQLTARKVELEAKNAQLRKKLEEVNSPKSIYDIIKEAKAGRTY